MEFVALWVSQADIFTVGTSITLQLAAPKWEEDKLQNIANYINFVVNCPLKVWATVMQFHPTWFEMFIFQKERCCLAK